MSNVRELVTDFLVDYGWLIDNDRLEDWANLFEEAGQYHIIPRDNYIRGMKIGLISCRNKAMIRDRILALRVANEYNIHQDRHIIGAPKILENTSQLILIESNFTVIQTGQDGISSVFSAGVYRDKLTRVGGELKLLDKLVIVDTFCVKTLIATPL